MPIKMLAIGLIILGILGLVYGSFTYTKDTNERQDRSARAVRQGQGNGQRSGLGRSGGHRRRWNSAFRT